MKSFKNYLNEIHRLTQRDFSGGEKYISGASKSTKWTPLPGGSGLGWATAFKGSKLFIYIGDKGETVGELCLSATATLNNVLKNPMEVDYITVHEDYQGRGIAKSLYGIVLSILKITLIAGASQTPGGRRNWLSLVKIPGLEVKGVIEIKDNDLGSTNSKEASQSWQRRVDKNADVFIDELMKLGGDYLGMNKYGSRIFAFDVIEGKGELQAAVKSSLSKIYNTREPVQVTLFARWKGK